MKWKRGSSSNAYNVPLANPEASFEAAVRHLFRHLGDVRELRRNPLVRKLFEKREAGSDVNDTSVDAIIRARVEALAAAYRDAAPADQRLRSKRQFAILWAGLQGRSVKAIAHSLQMSLRQCYRERSTIQRHIGEALRRGDDTPQKVPFKIHDVFETQMERAASRLENGDYALARRQYTALTDEGTNSQRLRALAARTGLELEVGATPAAEAFLGALSASLAQADDVPRIERAEAEVRVQLLQARLGWEQGSFADILTKLRSVQRSADRFKNDPTERLRALYADIVIEAATRAFDLGAFDSTRELLSEAKGVSDTISARDRRNAALLLLESNITFATGRPVFETRDDPMDLVNRAHSAAIQCGSIKLRLKTEMFLVALQRAHIDVVQQGALLLSSARDLRNAPLTALLSLELADLMLETPAWQRASRLLSGKYPQRSFYAGSFSMLKAVYQLKARDPWAVRKHARAAHSIATQAGAPRFQAAALRLLGYSSYLLGKRDDANDYISSAVPLAERYGSAPARLKTLRTAAIITGKQEYAREAAVLATVIQ
ncbi:MAG: hypothetical protein WBW76_08650 [Candidatus Cybelea sp.]